MLPIRRNPDMERRLSDLAKLTGPRKIYCARELIEELEHSNTDPRATAKLDVLRVIVRSSKKLRQIQHDA